MRYGHFLPKGGTIGFIAPSFGCNIEPYKSGFINAQKKWKKQGYQLSLGPNVYEGSGLGISSTPENCAAEFMEYYGREDNDVLISCGGGELMVEILPHVDFEKIKALPPKWFMGYSDNTNIAFLLATLADTAAVYGPCAATFGMEPPHRSLADAFGILTGRTKTVRNYDKWEKESLKDEDHPLVPYNLTEPFKIVSPSKEDCTMEGRLLGGCLDILDLLVGTKFDRVKQFNERYAEDGVIWFLEACDLDPMWIRRALWQLREAGWFETAKGFLIGRPYIYGEEVMGLDQYRAVTDMLEGFNVPILMDLDIGHLPPMMPLVEGSLAKVKRKGNTIEIRMDFC